MSGNDVFSRLGARLSRFWRSEPRASDVLFVLGLALFTRLCVVAWAAPRFPPAEDGHFYDIVARRIADGHGYTWLWPDGVVSYAAHYPVGYPALVGGSYAVFGSSPGVAMLLNAVIGTGGVWGVERMAREMGLRGPALLAGVLAALHPGYALYTPALMTEGVTAALLALAGAWAVIARSRGSQRAGWFIGIGLLSGVTALVRPQMVLLAPVLGAMAAGKSLRSKLVGSLCVTLLAVAVCVPWTVRNCVRLERCVFVSANGGWNLLIGSAQNATGRWVPLDRLGIPEACRTVFGEAEKDQCFGTAALGNIAQDPLRFLALVPKKLAATFDWSGAPGHYLNASNAVVFDASRKLWLGISEAFVHRSMLLLGLLGVARAAGKRPRLRRFVVLAAVPWLFLEHAWVAYLLLVVAAALAGPRLFQRPGVALGVSVVAATALTHAVFFGDGRYGFVTGLCLVALAFEAFHPENRPLLAGWRT